jgi:hypothetical protein
MSQLVNKGFKRFGAFKGLVEQKNVVFNSSVCKLGLFWHSWAFKTLVSHTKADAKSFLIDFEALGTSFQAIKVCMQLVSVQSGLF